MNKWMEVAYNEAVYGMTHQEGGPFGAVIVKDGNIIAKAHNRVLLSNDPTAHAEVNAIREASQLLQSFDLSGCVLYTTCKPCPMCLGAVMWARIAKVYYGTTEKDAAAIGFDDARFYNIINGDDNSLAMEQIDYKESKKLFDKWMQNTQRQLY